MFYFLLYLIAFLYRAVWDGHNRVLTKLSAGLGHLHRSPWFTDIHKWKWRDIRPSMVTHTLNSCSAFTHPKCTHTAVYTHTRSSWHSAAPGEELGVRCLAQGHLSRGIEGGESAVHSLPPPTIPAGPETRTHNLWITSPTL